MATNYEGNYDDKRLADVEADKKTALNEFDQKYGQMIGGVDDKYNALIDESQKWAEQQTQLQKEQTAFTIDKIEEQKARAEKDYQKEQSGAYVDWQKQSNQYGANAEAMAAQGMTGTGYSESSQVSMYNTYQNRVATAREAFIRATTDYDMAIKDAQLQNNSVLAEIAHNAQQQRLELILEGFQYKNNLIIDQMNKKQEVDNTYYARYQDELNRINTEKAFAEQVRQYNQDYDLRMKQYEEGIRQFNEEIARLKAQDEKENALKIKQLELQKQQLAEEKRQFNATMASKNSGSGGSGGSLSQPKSSGSKAYNAGKNMAASLSSNKRTHGGGGGSWTPKFTGSTYSEAVAFMEKNGVPGSAASNIMTKGEWTRRKASHNAYGTGSAAVTNHSTYESYLKEKCLYYVEKYRK